MDRENEMLVLGKDTDKENKLVDSQTNEKQLGDGSYEFSENKISRKSEESQTVDSGSEIWKNEKQSNDLITTSGGSLKGDSLTLESVPNLQDLSSLISGSTGYLNSDDNHSHDTENIVGSSVSNNMVAMEHRPGPSSIQEFHDDQGSDPIFKPDSFDSVRFDLTSSM